MNSIETPLKRLLVNALFGCTILLILALSVIFRFYIDKQTNLSMDGLKQIAEEEIIKK
jgi:hypothetical protein